MSIKSILVPFCNENSQLNAIENAIILTKKLSSHASFLHIAHDPNDVIYIRSGFNMSVAHHLSEDIEDANEAKYHKFLKKFNKYTKKHKIQIDDIQNHKSQASASFKSDAGYIRNLIKENTRPIDLIIIGSSDELEYNHKDPLISSALYGSNKPVLFLPNNDKKYQEQKNIAIAWDGSKEASNAISNSLDILNMADKIYIIIAKEHSTNNANSARDLSLYLRTHNINTTTIIIGKEGKSVSEAIIEKAQSLNCDLLIAGAKTSTRLGYIIMGKTSKELLNHTKTPLLLNS